MSIIYYTNITFSLYVVHVDPISENDGYDLAEMSRRSSGHDYDRVDYETNSNLQNNKNHRQNPAIQNPYYESVGDDNVSKELVVDASPEEKERENVKVTENPYYE